MADNVNIFSELYNYIEQTSADFFDKVVKDESVLKGFGKMWEGYLDYKFITDKMLNEALKNMNIANKKEQEKILFKINQLESKINYLSRIVDKLEVQ